MDSAVQVSVIYLIFSYYEIICLKVTCRQNQVFAQLRMRLIVEPFFKHLGYLYLYVL